MSYGLRSGLAFAIPSLFHKRIFQSRSIFHRYMSCLCSQNCGYFRLSALQLADDDGSFHIHISCLLNCRSVRRCVDRCVGTATSVVLEYSPLVVFCRFHMFQFAITRLWIGFLSPLCPLLQKQFQINGISIWPAVLSNRQGWRPTWGPHGRYWMWTSVLQDNFVGRRRTGLLLGIYDLSDHRFSCHFKRSEPAPQLFISSIRLMWHQHTANFCPSPECLSTTSAPWKARQPLVWL